MEYAIIGLLSFAIILIVLSFSKKDKVRVLENQLEQLSIHLLQETYQLKKRMKILEEELLIQDEEINKMATTKFDNTDNSSTSEIRHARDKIFSLYKRGYTYEEIAKESNLTVEEVRIILEHVGMRGFQN